MSAQVNAGHNRVSVSMRYNNIRVVTEQVNFRQAVMRGLGQDQGLFFPEKIPVLDDIEGLLKLDFVTRSQKILQPFMADILSPDELLGMLERAFDFELPLVPVAGHEKVYALELFHGPSLAFKDFGARFLGQCFEQFAGAQTQTILTATSGDTGAAVAHAFYGMKNIRAVILYPQGKVTPLQEKLFCTLGGNISTIAIDGDFDACQQLVKSAFSDTDIRGPLNLNSANSINIARLLAQVCYYFEAAAQLGYVAAKSAVYSVPSGNFGNATAGMIAHYMGLPMQCLIAATNANDTVPRFLAEGYWDPRSTVATLTNAMDVSLPNNFIRIQQMAQNQPDLFVQQMYARKISEAATEAAIVELNSCGYLADPHSALAYAALMQDRTNSGKPLSAAVFLCTAHPAKFIQTLTATLNKEITLPQELAAVVDKQLLSIKLANDYPAFKNHLLTRLR